MAEIKDVFNDLPDLKELQSDARQWMSYYSFKKGKSKTKPENPKYFNLKMGELKRPKRNFDKSPLQIRIKLDYKNKSIIFTFRANLEGIPNVYTASKTVLLDDFYKYNYTNLGRLFDSIINSFKIENSDTDGKFKTYDDLLNYAGVDNDEVIQNLISASGNKLSKSQVSSAISAMIDERGLVYLERFLDGKNSGFDYESFANDLSNFI